RTFRGIPQRGRGGPSTRHQGLRGNRARCDRAHSAGRRQEPLRQRPGRQEGRSRGAGRDTSEILLIRDAARATYLEGSIRYGWEWYALPLSASNVKLRETYARPSRPSRRRAAAARRWPFADRFARRRRFGGRQTLRPLLAPRATENRPPAP